MTVDALSALERMQQAAAQKERAHDILERNAEQFRESINAVLATDHGQFVMRVLLNKCWVFVPDVSATPSQRYERSILRDMYLSFRPYIDKDLRAKLEQSE